MNQIDALHPALTSNPVSLSKPGTARRFIVLVPPTASDYMAATQRIRALTTTQPACIWLMSSCKDSMQEPSLRRDLVTMSAMLRDENVHVDVKVEIGINWVEIVKQNYQTGDLIVCFAEQCAGFLHKPLSQILQSNLKVPIYILSNVGSEKQKSNLTSQVVGWLGSIGIMIGFSLLQSSIVHGSKDWIQSILLILSIIPEFWLILLWNIWLG